MTVISQEFVAALNDKFGSSFQDDVLILIRNRKYDKIVVASALDLTPKSVYAFLDKEGNLYKAAGYSVPAKGIRYTSDELMTVALEKADRFGGFLYKK